MKRVFLAAALLLGFAACSKQQIETYSGIDMVNFNDSLPQTHTFGYDPPSVTKATVMVRVNVIGRVADHPRTVQLVQTTQKGLENPAVEGKHFAFDPKDKWVIPAGATTAELPITLLRDASLSEDTYNLRLAVANSADFGVGDALLQQKTIAVSGKLLKPAFWDNNFVLLIGAWSERKQLFMFEVSGEVIDQKWFADRYSLPNAPGHYQAMFRNALLEFNTNPDNIASGAAPLTDAATGMVITF